MAWARDITTGEPVYILELDRTRTGAQCGCECPSCELPLIAVNAAKVEYLRRPHFRHPNGAEKNECMHLSARLAALSLLREQGVLLLPRRRVSGYVVGNSGTSHEAWVERPPERVRIRDFNFLDKVAAILTLEDGRQLRVQLMGTGTQLDSMKSDAPPMATISLDIDDMTIASMSPEELRSRITLVSENLCWISHFNELELKKRATEEAKRLADELMDLEAFDDSIFNGVTPKFRRETVLHLEVKKILSEAKEIQLPALQIMAYELAENGKKVEGFWERTSELMPLIDVQLEQRFGRVIPDVIAKIPEDRGGFMLIEVTVTNHIDDERLMRIKLNNYPTLEIDLSFSSGLITRSDLKKWVVHGLNTKRWLHHPEIQLQKQILESEMQSKVKVINEAERDVIESRKLVLAMPIEEIARDFLNAVYELAEFNREVSDDDAKRVVIDQAKKNVNDIAEKLSIHGYPEAIGNPP